MTALFGAVSFYHSIPEIPNLNLTSCLLARIFTRDIKDWAHPDIRELNPALTEMFERKSAGGDSLGASMRIRVARREEGASNTFSATSVRFLGYSTAIEYYWERRSSLEMASRSQPLFFIFFLGL